MLARNFIVHPKIHPSIAEGILLLSSVCDGAQSVDGKGFDKFGKDFGLSLAEQIKDGRSLTKPQQRKALKLLTKHHKQLSEGGINLPTEEELEAFLNPVDRLDVTELAPDLWQVVNATKGVQYTVTREEENWDCTCPASATCKHIKVIQGQLNGANVISFPVPTVPEPEPKPELIVTRRGLTLNEQQSDAVRSLIAWWADKTNPWFLLKGFAGTGKTTLVQEFISEVQRERGKSIVLCAPTNKATQVLRRTAERSGICGVDFGTVYQLLALKLTIDDDGNERVESDPKSDISLPNYDLVVVDEASMVPKGVWKLLEGFTRGARPKVLFMGDPAQLPPVSEHETQVFQIENQIELSQVMRYGGPILELVTEIRENLTRVRPVEMRSSLQDGTGVHLMEKWDWLDRLVADYQSDDYKKSADHCRAVAWTNKAVDWINSYCRLRVYGNDAPQFVPGERLIAIKPVISPRPPLEILLTTSSEVEIYEAIPTVWQGFKAWRIDATSEDMRQVEFHCLDQTEASRFAATLAEIRQEAMEHDRGSVASRNCWKRFYELKKTFAWMGYSYAVTVHKSQGSTFQNVYVAISDLLRNPKVRERNQLIYVACSRAAKNLFISE